MVMQVERIPPNYVLYMGKDQNLICTMWCPSPNRLIGVKWAPSKYGLIETCFEVQLPTDGQRQQQVWCRFSIFWSMRCSCFLYDRTPAPSGLLAFSRGWQSCMLVVSAQISLRTCLVLWTVGGVKSESVGLGLLLINPYHHFWWWKSQFVDHVYP